MSTLRRARRLRATIVAGAAALTLVLASCAAGDSTEDSAEQGGTETSDAAEYMEELAVGFETAVPTEGPEPVTDKSVWFISCGESIPDCSEPSAAAQEAAELRGMDFNIADGRLNEGGGNAAAVRTAIAASADAIIVHGFSCEQASQALQEANDAGILVMAIEGMDCNEAGGTGEPMFNVDMKYSETALTATDYFASWGTLAARYAIGASGGEAKLLHNAGTEPLMRIIDESFLAEFETCEGCEIVNTVSFGSPDYGPQGPWIQQFRSALAQNPTANATYFPVDAALSFSGGPQAVTESGMDMIVFGGTGGSVGMDLVRSGEMDAVTGAHDVQWMGWAAIDNINRALAGEETVPQGVGSVVTTADYNLPSEPGVGYQSSIDWRSAYMSLWGLD